MQGLYEVYFFCEMVLQKMLFPEVGEFHLFSDLKLLCKNVSDPAIFAFLPLFLARKKTGLSVQVKSKKKTTNSIDLSYLKDLYRGYGKIVLSYGNHFKKNFKAEVSDYELTLLQPFFFFSRDKHEKNWRHLCVLLERPRYKRYEKSDR